jgi:hypothetical protein
MTEIKVISTREYDRITHSYDGLKKDVNGSYHSLKGVITPGPEAELLKKSNSEILNQNKKIKNIETSININD